MWEYAPYLIFGDLTPFALYTEKPDGGPETILGFDLRFYFKNTVFPTIETPGCER